VEARVDRERVAGGDLVEQLEVDLRGLAGVARGQRGVGGALRLVEGGAGFVHRGI